MDWQVITLDGEPVPHHLLSLLGRTNFKATLIMLNGFDLILHVNMLPFKTGISDIQQNYNSANMTIHHT